MEALNFICYEDIRMEVFNHIQEIILDDEENENVKVGNKEIYEHQKDIVFVVCKKEENMGMIYIVFKNVVIEHGSFEDKVLKNRKVNVDDLYL